MKTTVDIKSFTKLVMKNAPSYKKFMVNAAKAKFNSAKDDMLEEFDNHPVTQEIALGPDEESDPSGLLGGLPNLFSFLGFNQGDRPEEEVRQMLDVNTTLNENNVNVVVLKTLVKYEFEVNLPTKQDLFDATPLAFSEGKSWLKCIETGLWGLSHYLFGLYLNPAKKFESSRSGPGLESKYEVRKANFKTTPYISEILKNFKKNLS